MNQERSAGDDGKRQGLSLRLPLFTGDKFVGQMTAVALVVVPSLLLATCSVPTGIATITRPELEIEWWASIAFLVVGGVIALGSFDSIRSARRQRPTDVLVSERGLTIQAGEADALEIPFDSIDAEASTLRRSTREKLSLATDLVIVSGDQELVVATGEETDSFLAILGLLRAQAGLPPRSHEEWEKELSETGVYLGAAKAPQAEAKAEPDDTPEQEVEIMTCSSCSAVLAPREAATVQCDHCGHQTAVPEPLRARFRELARREELDTKIKRRLGRLLSQPPARRASLITGGLLAIPCAAWIASFVVLNLMIFDPALTLGDAGAYASTLVVALLVPFLLGIAMHAAADLYAVGRRTVRLVALDFGAAPPATPNTPYRCRSCAAPLASDGDDLLVSCGYCTSVNVLGLAAPRVATWRRRAQAAELKAALEAYRRERSFRRTGIFVFTLPALAAAWYAICNPPAI